MDEKRRSRFIKAVFVVSIVTALLGGLVGAAMFEGPAFVGIFFGVILGFFTPWVIALLGYTFVALSTPTLGFEDRLKQDKEK
jgi:thiol:disulfide interchange protein